MSSGPNIPDAQRKTVAVKLRLSPEVAMALRKRAKAHGMTISAMVAYMLGILKEG